MCQKREKILLAFAISLIFSRIKLWNKYYVLELVKESESKLSGSITFYLNWTSNDLKSKGTIFNKKDIEPEKIKTLFSILNDSLDVINKLKSGEELNFNKDCVSIVEYSDFNKNGTFSYFVKKCDLCETRKCVKKIQPYVKFIDSLFYLDLEEANLLKKLPNNIHGHYGSLTQCCCGQEF